MLIISIALTTEPFSKMHPISRIPELERHNFILSDKKKIIDLFGINFYIDFRKLLSLAKNRIKMYGKISVSCNLESSLCDSLRNIVYNKFIKENNLDHKMRLRQKNWPICAGFCGGLDFVGLNEYRIDLFNNSEKIVTDKLIPLLGIEVFCIEKQTDDLIEKIKSFECEEYIDLYEAINFANPNWQINNNSSLCIENYEYKVRNYLNSLKQVRYLNKSLEQLKIKCDIDNKSEEKKSKSI